MSQMITYGIDCPHCDDGFAGTTTLDLTQPEDGPIRIDLEMSVAQSELTCDQCGCSFYVGDLDIQAENEECPVENEDDEDDEDQDGVTS
jgi:hypothetical protein